MKATLPYDILLNIAQYSKVPDMIEFGFTNKHYSYLIHNPQFWKHLLTQNGYRHNRLINDDFWRCAGFWYCLLKLPNQIVDQKRWYPKCNIFLTCDSSWYCFVHKHCYKTIPSQ